MKRICLQVVTCFLALVLLSAPLDAQISGIVSNVSKSQYQTYHLAVENSGLGLYGGAAYNQGQRNRNGWAGDGTLGNQEARLYLSDKFTEMGLSVNIQGSYKNVVADLVGTTNPESVILVGAHYDTTTSGDRPGGDDNASGTAAVLEIARVLSQYEFESTIRFVGFNAEEDGLLGSKDYVNNLSAIEKSNIVGMVNLDMILRPGFDGDPSEVIDLDLSTRTSHAASVAWANDFRDAASIYANSLTVDSTIANLSGGSDQDPFVAEGIAGFLASENTAHEIWGGSNDYYHGSEDASDRLANDAGSASGVTYDYDFATDVTRAATGFIATKAGVVAVPEPSGVMLFAVALVFFVMSSRRRDSYLPLGCR